MPNNQSIGRRTSVGLGIETTPGTEVAPTDWVKHLKLSFQRATTPIDNESAVGRPEDVNDSEVVEQWAEGNLEGKIGGVTFGYLLYNMFGQYSVATNADGSGTVKDHTFNILAGQVPPTLTLVRKDPITSRRHGMACIEQLEITVEAGGWVQFTSSIKAEPGVTGNSETVSYLVGEPEFTSKHATLKLASLPTGLAAATALAIKSGKITMSRPVKLYFPLGQSVPSIVTTGKWSCTGEFVLQYGDTTLEDLWFNNTIQALQLAFVNTDLTIGTSAHPGLVFTAPKVRLNTFSMSDDLDDIVEQTVGFKCQLDLASGYMLRAVLTNQKATY